MSKPITVWQKYNRVWGERMIRKGVCDYEWVKGRVKTINTKLIDGVSCYIDTSDYPDLCNSYIEEAFWKGGGELSEEDLEILNDDSSYVYECCMEQLH
jgi:hypothetical protein